MSMTVASFLRAKLQNMSTWLSNEGIEAKLPDLHDIQIVALAQHLHEFAEAIQQRTFTPILTDKENIPLDVLKVLQEVERNPPLHDKFWRYLKLFSDTVSVQDE